MLAFAALKLPTIARLENFLFLDWGANLSVQDLIDRGERPAIDFFYPYGLLPLAIGRAWLAAVGRAPWGYLLAVAACHVLACWGLARVVVATRAGLLGAAFVALALPVTLPPTYPNLAHGIETVLLIHALADLASGRLARSLAILTACLFVKPSMAYVAGAAVVAWGLMDRAAMGRISIRLRLRAIAAHFAPAALTGVILAVALGLMFGFSSLRPTLIPTAVAALYRDANYGFFHGTGRRFWLPPDATLAHYLATPRAFWIAATLTLLAAAVVAVLRPSHARRFLVTCALLHIIYVCLFFAGETSWLYYAFLPVTGVASLAGAGRTGRFVVLAFLALAIATDRTLPREVSDGWREVGLRPSAYGLWSEPRAFAAYQEALAALDRLPSPPTVLLSMSGCAPTLDHRFEPVSGIFLLPGMDGFDDVKRTASRISAARSVFLPAAATQSAPVFDYLTGSPPLAAALRPYRLAWANDRYQIWIRGEDRSEMPLEHGPQPREGPRTVRELMLHQRGKLPEGPVIFGNQEQRIISESVPPTTLTEDPAPARRDRLEPDRAGRIGERQRAQEGRAPPLVGRFGQGFEQLGVVRPVVAVGAGVAGRQDAGRAAEGVDRQPRVVGHRP
jgi:hypothetical protein